MLHSSPWLYTYSNCHQMITQQRPKGIGVVEGSPKMRFFGQPIPKWSPYTGGGGAGQGG